MRFGPIPLAEAEGAILAHSLKESGLRFSKGHCLTVEDIDRLKGAGLRHVVAAKLDPGDVGEDAAAARLAEAITGPNLRLSEAATGRVNLYATAAGVVTIDTDRVSRFNRMDEAITLATLPQHARVADGQMVATLKIIPFAVSSADVSLSVATMASQAGPVLSVTAFKPRRIGLIQTRLPGTPGKLLDKTVAVTRARVEAMGASLMRDRRCAHEATTLRGEIRTLIQSGADIVLIAGASAITDRRDVLPSAVEMADGEVLHFGMPVDPGNLLLLGRIGQVPVLGLPGCARSPKLNGFDWVLERLVAGLTVDRAAIMGMGVGGLLTEIPARPVPRAEATRVRTAPKAPRIAGIVLAAGTSRRMGETNKLLAPLGGRAMVARVADRALASRLAEILIVTGHDGDHVAAALPSGRLERVHNPEHGIGMGRSLGLAVAHLDEAVDGVVVMLGDMPLVQTATLDALIAAFDPSEGHSIIVPTFEGRRGNPILLARRFFDEMAALDRDEGARAIVAAHEELLREVPVDDPGILRDADTPDRLADLSRVFAADSGQPA